MLIKTIGAAALLLMMAAPAVAQRGQRGSARAGMRGMMGGDRVENALRMQDRLELTEDQIGQLDAVRRTRVAERQAATNEMAELQSQLRAGQMTREAFRDAMQGRRDSVMASADDPLSEILTEDQVSQLGRTGRRGAARGARGFRGQRGFQGRRGFQERGRRFRRD